MDLVISDLHMPQMDGLGLVRHVRENRPDTPILMITAEGSDRKQTEALIAGVTGYLVKPGTPQQLTKKLHAIFGAPGGPAG